MKKLPQKIALFVFVLGMCLVITGVCYAYPKPAIVSVVKLDDMSALSVGFN